MQRVLVAERPDWRTQAGQMGFHFHTLQGVPYWDESAYYRFSLSAIENDLEKVTEEVHELCMDLVSRAVRDEVYLRKLAIPEPYWDFIRHSYRSGEPHIYGRMDLAYDGNGPAKLYELNYDTPTSIYEAGVFQWLWLKQCSERGLIPRSSDQFNSLHDRLREVFRFIAAKIQSPLHFASVRESVEDRATVDYLRDVAQQAGLSTLYLPIEDIGDTRDGAYTDLDDRLIRAIFKLYPWEYMFADEFGRYLPTANTTWFEPPWKSILSNKAALALLWELHPGHPNLLATYIEQNSSGELPAGWVRKPFYSREGANVEIATPAGERLHNDGPYTDGPFVRQAFHPLPRFGDNYALVGSWVIGDCAAGIGIREASELITTDTSRFVPHIIAD
jgi:glutathionylspermidine synthase